MELSTAPSLLWSGGGKHSGPQQQPDNSIVSPVTIRLFVHLFLHRARGYGAPPPLLLDDEHQSCQPSIPCSLSHPRLGWVGSVLLSVPIDEREHTLISSVNEIIQFIPRFTAMQCNAVWIIDFCCVSVSFIETTIMICARPGESPEQSKNERLSTPSVIDRHE